MRLHPYYPGKMAVMRHRIRHVSPEWTKEFRRRALAPAEIYVDADHVLNVAKERMELPEGCERLKVATPKSDQHALDVGIYLAGRAPSYASQQAALIDYQGHRNAAYDPDVLRQRSAGMQAAEYAGQPIYYDAPWSPWPAAFVCISFGVLACAAVGLAFWKHWI